MITRTLGWIAIVLAVIILLVFAAIRLADMTQNPPPIDAFGVRYVQHRWVALLHMVPGLLFLTLAPLQFVARIRQRRIGLHRGLGRMLAICAAISGLFALAMGVASIRVFVGLFTALSDLGVEEVFGASFWLGFSVNLLVAEVWINHTRVAGQSADRAS